MKYSSYYRLIVNTGEIENLPFVDIDGYPYGVTFEGKRGEGVYFTRHVALEIVNRWNTTNAWCQNHHYAYWID
jgi:hypothetical protein